MSKPDEFKAYLCFGIADKDKQLYEQYNRYYGYNINNSETDESWEVRKVKYPVGKMADTGKPNNGIQIISHEGCGNARRLILAASDSVYCVDKRGPIVVENFHVKPEWVTLLRVFCSEHKLNWHDPQWLLARWQTFVG